MDKKSVDFVILVVHQIEGNYGTRGYCTDKAPFHLCTFAHLPHSSEIYEEPLTELCHRT